MTDHGDDQFLCPHCEEQKKKLTSVACDNFKCDIPGAHRICATCIALSTEFRLSGHAHNLQKLAKRVAFLDELSGAMLFGLTMFSAALLGFKLKRAIQSLCK